MNLLILFALQEYTMSVRRRWPLCEEGSLTGEVLSVIVGARCRRGVCGGGVGVV